MQQSLSSSRRLASGLCLLGTLSVTSLSAHAQLQTAGALLVNLEFNTLTPGDLPFIGNSGTLGGGFDAVGGGATIPSITPAPGTGVNSLYLDGDDFLLSVTAATPSGGVPSRLDAPAGLAGPQPVRSVEVWVYNNAPSNEETVLAWGKRGGGDGTNFSALYGYNPDYGALGQWGAPDRGWAAVDPPPSGRWHHIAWVHSGPGDAGTPADTTSVYVDGVLDSSAAEGQLDTHPGPMLIGSQMEPDGITPTGALRGSLYLGKVRIHGGALTGAAVLNNYDFEKAAFPVPGPAAALTTGPIHRWSFNETAGTAVADLAGNLTGQVKGTGTEWLNGQVVLPGAAGNPADGAYVDLPNRLISNRAAEAGGSGEITLEMWMTAEASRTWSRFMDFGSSLGAEVNGPGGGGEGYDYLILTAQQGDDVGRSLLSLRHRDPVGNGPAGAGGPASVQIEDSYPHAGQGVERHVTIVWKDGEPMVVYEGVAALREVRPGDVKMIQINDVNCWLGRSNWTGDANLQGSINEFRVYDRALTPQEVAKNDADGPNAVVPPPPDTDADGLPDWYEGRYSAVLNAGTPGQGALDGDADGLSNLQEFQRGLNAASDDTDGDGLKDGAEITATTNPLNPDTDGDGLTDGAEVNTHSSNPLLADTDNDGYTDGQEIVGGSNPSDPLSFPGLFLVNRYSFNTASGAAAVGAPVIDSVSGQNGAVRGEGAVWTGTEIVLTGGPDSNIAPYVDLPNSIASRFSKNKGGRGAITVEAWLTVPNPVGGGWQRIFDFGSSWPGYSLGEIFGPGRVLGSGNDGRDYLTVTAARGTEITQRRLEWRDVDPAGGTTAAALTVDWDPAPEAIDAAFHMVFVMDEVSGQVHYYENGVQKATGSTAMKLSNLNDVNNWLGRSNWTADGSLNGSFDEFRIYDGVMSAADVVKSGTKGPNTPATGTNAATDITALQVLNAAGWPQWWAARNPALPAPGSDTDTDGLTALQELGRGSDSTKADTDGDGLSDAAETNTGAYVSATDTGTSPAVADTDHDGLNDGPEIAAGSNPFSQDTDGDLAFDGADAQPLAPAASVLTPAHHWTFNEGTAGPLNAGTVFPDIAGGAAFPATVLGNGATSENGQVVLPGGANTNDTAYIDLPNGLIKPQTKVTIVAWYTVLGNPGDWSRVFDFGSSNGAEVPPGAIGNGTTYLFYSAQRGAELGQQRVSLLAPDGDSGTDINISTETGTQIFIALTVDSSAGDSSVYSLYRDGEWNISNGGVFNTLNEVDDVNNWLGRSQFVNDETLNGSFNEFRIYNGILNSAAIEALYAAGPVTGGGVPAGNLSITDVRLNGANIEVTFASTAGSTYLLESSDNLTTWNTVVNNIAAAAGATTQTSTPASAPGRRYFRIRQIQ